MATSYVTIFTLEGGSVIFEKVQRNLIAEFDDINFKMKSSHNPIIIFFHHSNNLIIEKRYESRLIFNTTTFSLELKNLQKNDSGLYECLIRWNENITKVMYELFVLGRFIFLFCLQTAEGHLFGDL